MLLERPWQPVATCEHCGVRGSSSKVSEVSTFHRVGCPLLQWACRHCGLLGTETQVKNVSSLHENDCPRRLWVCQHCALEGTEEQVKSVSAFHKIGCPRCPRKVDRDITMPVEDHERMVRTFQYRPRDLPALTFRSASARGHARRRWECKFCGIAGTEDEVKTVGQIHKLGCPRLQCRCKHCGIVGSELQVSSLGVAHKVGCPRKQLTCHHCGLRGSAGDVKICTVPPHRKGCRRLAWETQVADAWGAKHQSDVTRA